MEAALGSKHEVFRGRKVLQVIGKRKEIGSFLREVLWQGKYYFRIERRIFCLCSMYLLTVVSPDKWDLNLNGSVE